MSDWWNGSGDPLTVCSRGTIVQVGAILPETGNLVVARLDGAKMTDADVVFYEFSDALLFPGYFGWNWNALSDCLRDLNWLPADAYLIVVERAPLLMSGSPDERQTLFRVLSRAARSWASPLGRPEGKGVPFKVLLLCDRDDEAVEMKRRSSASTFERREILGVPFTDRLGCGYDGNAVEGASR
ncbi:barstar family protein [Micromonospora chersina]|uniref:barstar family protein n=1 Tax=Micromonospora chersina TaxID=47854 RepID=UPI00371DC31A